MIGLLFVVGVIVVVLVWNAFIYKQSAGRGWSPLWMAFNSTAVAGLFLIAGLVGYTLDRHDRFVRHTAWTGQVIWSQVGVGLVAAVLAAYFWRQGLRLPAHRSSL